MNPTGHIEAERPRLVRIAGGVLEDRAEGEDIVQQAWLRLNRTTPILRQYLTKGSDLRRFTAKDLDDIANLINDHPRQV